MKLRLLFSVLFVIATSLTALHQLEHIKGAHDSTACSVCIVDHHSVSGDIIVAFEEPLVYKFESISLTSQTFTAFSKKTANQANAPPLVS
ncbi:MAG: hypothetical protein FP820_06810 [Sulfurimonas sp.]|nr:hypothetical protein [Sulfurimonas sp.]MBU1216581.1 hypothetical protein [bacterium]MBU1433590.1 hypothetical protein [bacterium]MBU1503229.1 hypothetical protein [bacterium]MBU3938442.1 hypothetical protein [bacterium]